MRTLIFSVAACLIAAVTVGLPATAAELGTQKSSDRGVTVAVTPLNLSGGVETWDFKIVLDTHSQDLSDYLVKSATILDDKGNRHPPVKWEGAGPGGHHREGVLRFKPLAPQPQAIELRISRPGEAKPRVFSWQLN